MMRPRYSTTMRSATLSNSSSSEDTSRIATPRVASGADVIVDRGHRADIEAAGRLRRDQTGQVGQRDLAREHCFLLVAAGQAREGRAGPARADVEPLHHRGRLALQRGALEKTETGELVETVEIDVLGEAHTGHASHRMAVFRNDADTGGRNLLAAQGR